MSKLSDWQTDCVSNAAQSVTVSSSGPPPGEWPILSDAAFAAYKRIMARRGDAATGDDVKPFGPQGGTGRAWR